jgi:hypothetical protein
MSHASASVLIVSPNSIIFLTTATRSSTAVVSVSPNWSWKRLNADESSWESISCSAPFIASMKPASAMPLAASSKRVLSCESMPVQVAIIAADAPSERACMMLSILLTASAACTVPVLMSAVSAFIDRPMPSAMSRIAMGTASPSWRRSSSIETTPLPIICWMASAARCSVWSLPPNLATPSASAFSDPCVGSRPPDFSLTKASCSELSENGVFCAVAIR